MKEFLCKFDSFYLLFGENGANLLMINERFCYHQLSILIRTVARSDRVMRSVAMDKFEFFVVNNFDIY